MYYRIYNLKSCKVLFGTYTWLHNQTLQSYTISVCAYVGVLYSLEILPRLLRSTYKFDFLFSNLTVFWSITQSEMLCYVSVLYDLHM